MITQGLDLEQRLPLSRAAALVGTDPKTLKRAIDLGQVRVFERRPTGRARTVLDQSWLLEDIEALPRCPVDGCEDTVLLGSKHCAFHARAVGLATIARNRERALAAERDWYSAPEVARLAGVSRPKVHQDIRAGVLDAELCGATYRVPAHVARAYRFRVARGPRGRRPTTAELGERRRRAVELYERGYDEDRIARELGCARSTVCNLLEHSGIERDRRRSTRQLPSEERAQQVRRAQELSAEGKTPHEIAALLDISLTLAHQHLALGDPDASRPALRRCDYCGDVFTSKDPHIRRRRYCSTRCEREGARKLLDDTLATLGLIRVTEAAERMGLRKGTVQQMAAAGLLGGELVKVPQNRATWGVSDAEIQRLEKARSRDNRYRKRWLSDVDVIVGWLEAMGSVDKTARTLGVPIREAERVERARVAERVARLNRLRRGRPPRSASTTPARHLRWQGLYRRIEAEMAHEHEVTKSLVGTKAASPAPTPSRILRQLVLEDWASHPEDWPRDSYPPDPCDPDGLRPDCYDPGVRRVRKALKGLQNAGTENLSA